MDNGKTTRPGSGMLKLLVAVLGAVGLLGPAAEAKTSVALERAALEARVDAVRQILRVEDEDGPAGSPIAQWYNWGNWGNWNNWPNWGNWANWFNR